MRGNPFSRDALTTEEEIEHIRSEIVHELELVSVSRKIFPFEQSKDAYYYSWYDEEDVSEAVISHSLKPQAKDVPDLEKKSIIWPGIHKESLLNYRDYRMSQQNGNSKLRDRTIANLAKAVRNAEDRLLLSGECPAWLALGVEGLFTATGRGTNVSAGNWPANVVDDIAVAQAGFDTAGLYDMAPVMIAPPALVTCLNQFIANTAVTYKQAILDSGLLADILPSHNAYAADCGVDSALFVMPGADNFWAATGIPLETRVWEDETGNLYLTVRETVTPVIARPESIFEITDVVCA